MKLSITRLLLVVGSFLWMAALTNVEVGHPFAASQPTVSSELSHQVGSNAWVDKGLRHQAHRGYVNEKLVESFPQIWPSVQASLLSGADVDQDPNFRHYSLIYFSLIGPHKLRRLIFPFHSFW